MQLDKRVSKIEARQEMQHRKPLDIVVKIVHCACQLREPEKFRELDIPEFTPSGTKIIRSVPKDSDFKCTCHMKNSKIVEK